MTKESYFMSLEQPTSRMEYRTCLVKGTDLINPKLDTKEDNVLGENKAQKGWSDMTETEGSDSEDDSKLVIDMQGFDLPTTACSRLKSSPSLRDTARLLNGNLKRNIKSESSDDDSDNEPIVVSSSGAPDRFRFVTEIFVPKMRGFEELSDRCILDSVSVSLTLDQVVKSSMEQFTYYLHHSDLTDTQLEITKYVRRRARNRVAARKSRMKKLNVILSIMAEIKEIREKKEELRKEKLIMEHLRQSWYQRICVLQEFLISKLEKTEDTSDLSPLFQLERLPPIKQLPP